MTVTRNVRDPSILQISEVVSMAVVKIGDSILVRLAHQSFYDVG